MMSRVFSECLVRGEEFENFASKWIKQNFVNWWITDSRNHAKVPGKTGLGGPAMVKGDDRVVLPDFRLERIQNGVREVMWIDAKLKTQPFTLPKHAGEKFYTIDPRSFEDYCKLLDMFPGDQFWVLLGCLETKLLYMWNLGKIDIILHDFNNEYGRLTPCFAVNRMKLVGNW